MTRLRIQTPSRLHFGLLSRGPQAPRQFGGVGLMIEAPGIALASEPAERWDAEGPLADRVLRVADRVASALTALGHRPDPLRFRVERAPDEHVGLGVGTQLSLAVAYLIARHAGVGELRATTLAQWAGRGRRSGIGLHGFERGGLIVDGGHRDAETMPPLVAHLPFPDDWSVLLVLPRSGPGLHGAAETRAFATLPPIPDALTDRLCRLVLLGLLPAVVERDIIGFGQTLTEIQQLVGQTFAAAQGGLFARPEFAAIAELLRAEGWHGIGQSSWGPTLYAFSAQPAEDRSKSLDRLQRRLDGMNCEWIETRASPRGMIFEEDPH